MPHGTLALGNVEITALCDVEASYDLKDAYPPPPGGWADRYERDPVGYDGPGIWHFHDHCFLVRSEASTILVDLGVGPEGAPATAWLGAVGRLPSELEAVGVPPGQIGHVVITHLHGDHFGWILDEAGEPSFPNARHHLHEADWLDWPVEDDEEREAFERLLRPLEAAGLFALSREDLEIEPGVRLLHAPGHTAGHRCVIVGEGDERALIAGDLLHHLFQVRDPEWRTPYDENPDLACENRRRVLARVESDGMLFLTAHLPHPFGRLLTEAGERRFVA